MRKSWWVDFRFNGRRHRKRSPDNSRAGAQAYEALLRQKISRGETLEEPEETSYPNFEEFAWKWFHVYVEPNNKASEISNKEIALRKYLIPFFGNSKLNKIDTLKTEEFKAKMTSGSDLSNKTINNVLTIFAKCLNSAKDWEMLDKVPKIQKLKVAPHRIDFLTEEESELLLQHSPGIWNNVFLVALKTGMRRGELLALSWEDINWEKKLISVSKSMHNRIITSTKSNRIRHIPMTSDIYEALLKRKRSKGFVFADDNKNHFSMRRLNDSLDQICKNAKLRKITPHILRHTFASHLAMKGAPIQAIQKLLGHSDIQTTMIYAHLSNSIYQETISLLESKPKDEDCGQHMGNKNDISDKFMTVLARNNIENSANIK